MTSDKPPAEIRRTTAAAMTCAALMLAFHVGARATRDALFLERFPVTALPAMVVTAALLAMAVVLVFARAMARLGPARLVPSAFAASAVLLLAEWALARWAARAAAVTFYLHIAALGAVLLSGFWSVVNEHYDPRSAKRTVARIAGAATAGGPLGGLLAERVGATLGTISMLPLLAVLHVACALALWRLRDPSARRQGSGAAATREGAGVGVGAGGGVRGREDVAAPVGALAATAVAAPSRSGLAMLVRSRYLRNLALLVLATGTGSAIIDYVFKSQVKGAFPDGPSLMRFFAVFYASAAIATFVVNWLVTRPVLERFGLARAAAAMPVAVAAGAVGALVAPGFISAVALRGGEAIADGSLYRAAYEVLFTPIPPAEKRATKSVIDVGMSRLGDVLGGGLVAVALLLGAHAHSVMMGLVAALMVAGAILALRLHRGYVRALEKSLLARAVELELGDVKDSTTRATLLQTLATVAGASDLMRQLDDAIDDGSRGTRADLARSGKSETGPRADAATPAVEDPLLSRAAELRSGDVARVRGALAGAPLELELVTHVIPLLAWDGVSAAAHAALAPLAARAAGQLCDALLDSDQEFAVRRRIPRLLGSCRGGLAVEGLLRGLADARFEVRYRCGRALLRIRIEEPDRHFAEDVVRAAILRGAAEGRRVWESQRLLDTAEADEPALVGDELLQSGTSRGLEHVFTLLALLLPPEPLRVAFRGLQTDDPTLRGTALEYLESVLPEDVRRTVWPQLEEDRPLAAPSAAPSPAHSPSPPAPRSARASPGRPGAEALAALMRSTASIELNLAGQRTRLGKKVDHG